MTNKSGYKTSIFVSQPVDESYLCPICMDVLRNAVSVCSEGHLFCKACISSAVQRTGRCPLCRSKIKACNFHKVRLLNDAISQFVVKCETSRTYNGYTETCPWTGPLRDLAEHRNHHCPVKLKYDIHVRENKAKMLENKAKMLEEDLQSAREVAKQRQEKTRILPKRSELNGYVLNVSSRKTMNSHEPCI